MNGKGIGIGVFIEVYAGYGGAVDKTFIEGIEEIGVRCKSLGAEYYGVIGEGDFPFQKLIKKTALRCRLIGLFLFDKRISRCGGLDIAYEHFIKGLLRAALSDCNDAFIGIIGIRI